MRPAAAALLQIVTTAVLACAAVPAAGQAADAEIARVLDGRWGEERHAIAIPKGREAGLDFLRVFSAEIQASGLVNAAAARAGLKGIMVSGK